MTEALMLILAAFLIPLAALSSSEHATQLPLVQAGYSMRCDPVPTGPIVKNKPVMTYQTQRGIA